VSYTRRHAPDLRYHEWHRTLGDDMPMLDLDSLEVCRDCYQPLALLELADWGTREKAVTGLHALACRAEVPAYLVRHDFPDPTPVRLSVRRIGFEQAGRVLSPAEYVAFLRSLRTGHRCQPRATGRTS
jgi:hypothetical protein